eukprot:CAMPEP_0195510972 /NCGR_PEP_ID=MMETSP0794_2-20130614/3454_1 /TAXON_ID=515487 /ORGANISM="Stephanopyxis turris, Strain CCMP 815" /LENGTH=410 /DNA_ID=CAMNT_0040638499 /DNA_START=45 /DNA_END=1277 /DNA_ORIENTATION=+
MAMMNSLLLLSPLIILSSRDACVRGFTTVAPSAFVGQTKQLSSSITSRSATAGPRMDMEENSIDQFARDEIRRKLFGQSLDQQILVHSGSQEIREQVTDTAENAHGMPWRKSIQEDSPLTYMPFWEWQLDFMKAELSNLQLLDCNPEENKLGQVLNNELDFTYNENLKKKARIVNLCFRSDEYRKIRLTYYDAGDGCQVFNSVWYPDTKYNLPILGVDVLAFNRKRHLAIVDFQPIHEDESMHSSTYEHILSPIKSGYNNLKGQMSSKFYDETKFFSQEMVFGRFEDESIVPNEVFPAFKEYVTTHLDILRNCDVDESLESKSMVLDRQAEYDSYSAERDPAAGLFAAMFGKEWAEGFIHDFLFDMSNMPQEANKAQQQNKVPLHTSPREQSEPKLALQRTREHKVMRSQ